MQHSTLLGLTVLMLWVKILSAQTMVVKTANGTETTYELATLQSVAFGQSTLLVNSISEVQQQYALADIAKLYFADVPSVEHTSVTETTSRAVSVYPNPARETLRFKNLSDGVKPVKIYRIDGVLMYAGQVSSGSETVDISTLDAGIYIVTIQMQVIRFSKL
jgi:hypothetical protein